MLSALCHKEGAAGPKPCPEGLRLGGEGGGIQRLLQIHGPGRHWTQSISGSCPSSAPPWVDAGKEVLRWRGREERTYHLIVDRGGWWVVVGEQSCRDWPPVSQVIILEEKGVAEVRGYGWAVDFPPSQVQGYKGASCILSQSRVQTEMYSNPIHNNLSETSRPEDRSFLFS